MTTEKQTSFNRPSARTSAPVETGATTTKNGGTTPPKKTTRRRRKKKRRISWKKIFLFLFILCLIGVGVVTAYVAKVLEDLPEWDEDTLMSAKTTFIYDSEGLVYNEIHGSENRTYVTLDEIPQYLIDAFIATEDTRFYDHNGIDVIRIFGAVIADIKAGSFAQGASTITMQLARNAILEDNDKAIDRKIKEAFLALQLEQEYTKDDILTLYLNEIYFGHSAYGVQAASQTIYGKDVGDLTMSEAATLVGIVRSPATYSPILNPENSYTVKNQVLTNLIKYFPEYEEEATLAMEDPIVIYTGDGDGDVDDDYLYPWYTDHVIDEAETILSSLGYESVDVYRNGYRIYTTLDTTVQKLMEAQYADEDNFPSSSTLDPVQSAMAVIDVDTGALIGVVGGREHTTLRGFNRGTDLQRQPGSTFKPVAAYAPAIEAGMAPSTVVNDVLTQFTSTWTPSNYDGSYRGTVTMTEACKYSINVASIKFMQLVGVSASIDMINKMGFDLGPEDENLSIALGGLTYGVSPMDMAAAYATFANGGVYTEPWCISKIEDTEGNVIYEAEPTKTVAMKETTAYLVTTMLMETTSSGTGTNAQISGVNVGSKTGTVQLPDTAAYANVSSGNKDAWFAAITPEYAAVIWMGYDNEYDSEGNVQYLKQVYGGKYPAQITQAVLSGAHSASTTDTTSFVKPSGIVSVEIDADTGMLPNENTINRTTALFDKDNVPTESYIDTGTGIAICAETGLLANAFCEDIYYYYPPAEPSASNVIVGTSADVPTETCEIHTQVTAMPDYDLDELDEPTIDLTTGAEILKTPSPLILSKATDSSIYASWADANTGSVKYEVMYWADDVEAKTITTYFKDLTITGLESGTVYSVQVRTIDDGVSRLSSSWSTTTTITTTGDGPATVFVEDAA